MEGKTYQSVGRPGRKKDDMAFLLGKPAYVDDVTPRDCLVVKVLRSPTPTLSLRRSTPAPP